MSLDLFKLSDKSRISPELFTDPKNEHERFCLVYSVGVGEFIEGV